jgi:hypothetical protein
MKYEAKWARIRNQYLNCDAYYVWDYGEGMFDFVYFYQDIQFVKANIVHQLGLPYV